MACHQHCASSDVIASRRSFIAGVACTAIVPGAAFAQLSGPGSDADVRFMRMAIEEARQGDFPFGAVIVRDGAVIARGRNLGRSTRDPTAHGEMVAIRRGLADHGPDALRGSTLYTSGESCVMCMGCDPLVSHGETGFCRVDCPTRHQDRPDHADRRRYCREGSVRPHLDHRRRARRRGDGAVYEVVDRCSR